MAFSITARWPLGTYRGAAEDGGVEAFPSVTRLFSALLCAAGVGPRAVLASGGLEPGSTDLDALRWLEEHLPDSVYIPPLLVNRGNATAYRDEGALRKDRDRLTIKKSAKAPNASVAIGDSFVWTWAQAPPPNVVEVLEALCSDVPHLGGAESPVVLVATSEEEHRSSHRLDPDADMFVAGGEDVEIPTVGRLAELAAAHKSANVIPSKAKDKYKTDEWAASAVPTREAVALARYTSVETVGADDPWTTVLLLGVDRVVRPEERVAAAAAVHRALIRSIDTNGDLVPPLVSGVYAARRGGSETDGARHARPANHLAIQFLDRSMPVTLMADVDCALALMIPADADAGDLAALARGLERMTRLVRWRGGAIRVQGRPRPVSGSTLWDAPAEGRLRLWRTASPAIPDTRGVRDGRDWTFADAARLSLAFVYRDRVEEPRPGVQALRGSPWFRGLAEAVESSGARILDARPVRTSDVDKYVHKVNEHAVVRPYHAVLTPGRLASSSRSVIAIGQSRHLGGGLLVPVDVTESEVVAWD